MQKILFFHGGPGLNSNPERHLLTGHFKEAGFELCTWHEPSLIRPWNHIYKEKAAFENYLESAEQFLLNHHNGTPLIVFGYCFGCHPVRHLIKGHPDKISNVIITTPDFCLSESDRNILGFIHKDYEAHHDPHAREMEQILRNFAPVFDKNTEAGWRLAAANPRLFNYYWSNKNLMQQFLYYYSLPGFTIDEKSFFDVRNSWFEIKLESCEIPTVVIYGKHDKIINAKKEIAGLTDIFKNIRIFEFSVSSHYPHIEETNLVIEILKNMTFI